MPEAVNQSNGILVESENESQLLEAIAKLQTSYAVYDLKSISEEASIRYSYGTIGKQIFNSYIPHL